MNKPSLLLGITLWVSGCIIIPVGGGSLGRGDVAFTWAFDGGGSCADNRTDLIRYTLRRSDGQTVGPNDVDCDVPGVRHEDLVEGEWTITLQGLRQVDASNAVLVHEGEFGFSVTDGALNDLGVLVLAAAPPASLNVDWTFQTVNGGPTPNCEAAEVDNVRIIIEEQGGIEVFNEPIDCLSGPATIDQFRPGPYVVTLEGEGTYNGLPVTYYVSAPQQILLLSGTLGDLGAVQLDIIEDRFADLDVGWVLNGSTCAQAGVATVHVEIFRSGSDVAEDAFDRPCADGGALRTTFLPGDWRTVVTGAGTAGTWTGQRTQNAAPGQRATVSVTLNPP
ncbi:MAG: hypothetical protein AB2A00_13755 [Myxococcota bacterium]